MRYFIAFSFLFFLVFLGGVTVIGDDELAHVETMNDELGEDMANDQTPLITKDKHVMIEA